MLIILTMLNHTYSFQMSDAQRRSELPLAGADMKPCFLVRGKFEEESLDGSKPVGTDTFTDTRWVNFDLWSRDVPSRVEILTCINFSAL